MSLQQKLVVYVSGNRFTYFKFRFDEELADEEARVEPLERAELLYQLGDLLAHQPAIPVDEAERHFREAIRLAPEHAQAHAAMGRLYATDGRFAAAATYFDRAIELDPKNARVHSLYGWSILGEVFDGGTRSASETPQPMIDARELFRTAVRLDPSDSDAWAGLGKTFVFEKGDVTEGIQALNRAAQALPSRVDLLYDLMLLYIHSEQEQSALSLFDGLIRHRGDPELVRMAEDMLLNLELERAVDLFNAGQVEQARKLLLDAAERANDPRMKRTLMAQLASIDGTHQSNQAIDRFNQAVDAANEGRTDEAIALLEQVAREASDPELKKAATANIETLRATQLNSRVVAEYNRAVAELKAGNTDRAIEALEAALELGPEPELRDKIRKALDELKSSGS